MSATHDFGGTLTADDFVAAQTLHMRKWRKRQYIVIGAVMLLGVAIASFGWRMAGMVVMGAALGGFAGNVVLHARRLPGTWTRLFEQQKSLHERFTYSWDETGLTVSTPLGQAKRPWAHFIRHEEDAGSLLLYHSDAMFELIPKRWFDDGSTLDALRTEILRHPFAARR
ncbi:MAG TPA: YcxB family protein [Xanthomonadaceae bacterium]